MGLVLRRVHSPPFKGGVAAQRPGWLVRRSRSILSCSPEGRSFCGALQTSKKRIGLERLDEVAGRAHGKNLSRTHGVAVARHQNNGQGLIHHAKVCQELNTRHFRHLDIGNHDIDIVGGRNDAHCFLTRVGEYCPMTPSPDQLGTHLCHRLIVFHQQHFQLCRHGRVIAILIP